MPDECTQDFRNYAHIISGTFQETIVRGTCWKKSHKRVRVKFVPTFCLCICSLPLPQSYNLAWAHNPIENLVPGQWSTLKKTHKINEFLTWACDMVMWYKSADTLFWYLSINFDMDVQYQHDRTEKSCTASTSRCPVQSLRKVVS